LRLLARPGRGWAVEGGRLVGAVALLFGTRSRAVYHGLVPKDTNIASPAGGTAGRRPSGSTAADRQLKTTERKAAKIVEAATSEANRVRGEARAEAARMRADAEEHARRLVLDARATAEGVRAEGMELVSNLREMGDALRANAERLLMDIQSVHSRMVRELDRVDPDRGSPADGPGGGDSEGEPTADAGEGAAPAADDGAAPAADDGPASAGDPAEEELDVPDFIPRG
jgi:hypothetical protein